MTAETEALSALQTHGLLDVLKWGAPVAFAATDQLHDEDQGHDQGVVGYLNFKHLRDLIDRATANGRFKLGEGVDNLGEDVLKRGITPAAYEAMPALPADAVIRSDYKQSPGWSVEGYRVLLQSYAFGEIDEIKWAQRSAAKKRVADQLFVGSDTLFDDEEFGLESIGGIPDDDDFNGVTLVAAHAFDPTTKQFELYLGQSKNPASPEDGCWHWKAQLISGGTPIGGSELSTAPQMSSGGASTDVDDVPMRIKRTNADVGSSATNG